MDDDFRREELEEEIMEITQKYEDLLESITINWKEAQA